MQSACKRSGACCARADYVIQLLTPTRQEFRDCLLEIQPPGSREIHAEILMQTWDWKKFLEPMPVTYTGLAITEQEESVSHSFRFLQRSDVRLYKGFATRQHIHFIGGPCIVFEVRSDEFFVFPCSRNEMKRCCRVQRPGSRYRIPHASCSNNQNRGHLEIG